MTEPLEYKSNHRPEPGNKKTVRLDVRTVIQLALLCALMFAGTEVMNSLPNIHPVMLILLLCVRVYGGLAIYPVTGFVLLELSIYGLGIWSITYLYVWPLAVLLALPFWKKDSRIFWAVFAGIFGLCFGALTAAYTIILSGFKAAVAYWVSGIPFDIVHCISNFIICFFLLPPLTDLVWKLRNKSGQIRP